MKTKTWRDQAACKGQTALFFPKEAGSVPITAKRICSCCPVRAECAEAGLDEDEGVWGGLGPSQRRRRRREQRRAS